MKHCCHAAGCKTGVPPSLFMCKKHWFMLPKEQREMIWRHYRHGQENGKGDLPSQAYLEVAKNAVATVKAIEMTGIREAKHVSV